MMEKIIKKKAIMHRNGTIDRFLWCHKIPLTDLFEGFREIDLFKDKTKAMNGEVFLSMDNIGHRNNRYFYIRPTKAFEEFLKKQFFTGCSGIEIIQQRNKPNIFLVKCDEARILGSVWLDYKNRGEIEDYFKEVRK